MDLHTLVLVLVLYLSLCNLGLFDSEQIYDEMGIIVTHDKGWYIN